ncbi:MAG: methyltransferase domain-containing protein [archaeon]|nr:methyltransferase domain-containing protein [archaeon]
MEKKLCKVCWQPKLIEFVSFGKMPVANAFLKKIDLMKPEYFYNMSVGFCENCNMVQLLETPPYDKYIVPDESGKTNYAFFSSTSKFMEEHFAEMAKEIETKFLSQDSKVLEIGSNDGILLRNFKKNKVLGVEPSQNVAEIAKKLGIEVITDFFNEQLANRILFKYGKFKTIASTNVFLNIIDVHSAMKGIRNILEEKGVFVTEDPYIVDILEKNTYDQIYDEHIWYFSLHSLSKLYEMHGMEIFDAERQWVHGGSMRVYACKKNAYPKTQRFLNYFEEEKQKGINTSSPYVKFADNVKESRQELNRILNELKSNGKKIVGYAAASKGTIVQNYCDIGIDLLDYISDSTPFKQGLFSPGKHIPVVSPDVFHNDKEVNYALLGAWNHAKEIMGKEKEFVERGGRFIVHLPYPHIVQPGEFENLSENSSKSENTKGNTDLLGAEIKPLKIFANDQGYLFETLRADDKIFEGKFGQVLVSEVYPGVIKGLHLHRKQTDYTTCIKGNIKYILAKEVDGKVQIKTLIIGEKNPILIKTPPGLWHGYSPLANEKATILHLMDVTFDPKDDDTERKEPYAFGDVWTVKNG